MIQRMEQNRFTHILEYITIVSSNLSSIQAIIRQNIVYNFMSTNQLQI